ncbi:MAG: DUF402 domain-containing protein [Actinomycetota bacterium]
MSRPVTVQFLKNPDVLHWGFDAMWLGEDEWGDWIAVPKGTKRWKGEKSVRLTSSDAVFCAPRGEWWHLHYTGALWGHIAAFIDIVTPPRWVSENRYEMIDLDLDVALHVDGTVEVQDEDEFEVHQVKYGYTDEMIRGAVVETRKVVEQLQGGHEPFFDVAEQWLGRVDG